MKFERVCSHLFIGASAAALAAASGSAAAQTVAQSGARTPADTNASVTNTSGANSSTDIVVTAQKRSESINSVAMSVQAATGEQLTRLGVTDASSLSKIVPGFTANDSQYGTPIYTIRGIGFQDNALGSSPTVSVYVDEVPLPFPIETAGTTLDITRVEVLKGPQGTLFGENSTGGAVNFIANKPTDHLAAGGDFSFSRFNTVDAKGFVSGPLADSLDVRLAAGTVQSGPWQRSYTHPASLGSQDFIQGRLSLLFHPTSDFRALVTLDGFRDRSETQADQLYVVHQRGAAPLPAGYLAYTPSPLNARAADWSTCVRRSFVAANSCGDYRKNNEFYRASLRMDFDAGSDITLTSLTSYQHFRRAEPQDPDGTTYENLQVYLTGKLETFFQELRAAGKFGGRGNWIIGANYQHDKTQDEYIETFAQGSSNPIFGFLPLEDTTPSTRQKISTYAVFGNVSFPITSTITLEGGARYTKQDRDFSGCALDAGDGQWATVGQAVANFILAGNPLSGPVPNGGPGSCGSIAGPPSFLPSLYTSSLNEHNVSWRAGINWTPAPRTLVYFNVSKGYKSGSFPTVGAAANSQFAPVVQESLLAFEGGVKANILDRTLQFNAAAFYYDYKNKQVIGDILDPVFGGLNALVNIPKSHVIGFEASGVWTPVPGITISPSISYQKSKIDSSNGVDFLNYDPYGRLGDFTGQAFPLSPQWQGNVDGEYRWHLDNDMEAYVGANLSFQSRTNAGLGQVPDFSVRSRQLLDLRAGLNKGNLGLQIWGRNVTNQYYWTTANWSADAVTRQAGRPVTYGFTLSYRYQ